MKYPAAGQLTANIVDFCRALRATGLPVASAQVLDGLRAVAAVGLERRDDFRTALRCTLLTDQSQQIRFDELFRLYFDCTDSVAAKPATDREASELAAMVGELSNLSSAAHSEHGSEIDGHKNEQSPGYAYSAFERLRNKDFERMSAAELAAAEQLLTKDIVRSPLRASWRTTRSGRNAKIDARRSLQRMARSASEPVHWVKSGRRPRRPSLILLCDISASMRAYSRMFLALAHAVTARDSSAQTFVFATRLSQVSRQMLQPDVDAALSAIGTEVRDWDGGTRIASALRRFNIDWSRRILNADAVVVLLSDGLERDEKSDVGAEMHRLARSCRQLIWLNPLLRYDGFEPLAGGIRAMLKHADQMIPAHNVTSLVALAERLARYELKPWPATNESSFT